MHPFVTLILPIRNEAEYIVQALRSVLGQDYPSHLMELLIVDGQSSDGTPQIISRFLKDAAVRIPVQLLENPSRIVPNAMNIAMRQARGQVIIRVDGHCIIAPDYVRKCVEHIQNEGVDAVGGPMESIGETYMAKATAIGMSSSFGVGNSAFRTISGKSMWADTVPFPAYSRETVERAGLYDEELVRNQDDEYNYRIRELGGKILLADDVRSTYFSRTTLKGLWRQYFQYGFWKIRVLQKHPRQMSLRQFVPPAFVLGLILSALPPLSSFSSFLSPLSSLLVPLSLPLPLLYLAANLSASAITSARRGWNYLPVLPLIFAILHLSYGVGFLIGLVRFIFRWGDRTGRVPDWLAGRPSGTRALVPVFSPYSARSTGGPFKRIFDSAASALGLLVLSPILATVAVLIRRESSGPAFYWEARIGRYGKPFNILKFRTTYDQPQKAPDLGLMARDDERFTPLGRWLRAARISELPQLWNVLIGEMSLVGPRPEVVELVRAWPMPARQEVLSLRPGITSPASVTYRDEEQKLRSSASPNVMDDYLKTILPDKLRLDQLYVRNHTLLGDLDVIFMTLATLLPLLRESTFKPETLYNGFFSRLIRRYVSWFSLDCLIAFAAVSTAGLLWRMEGPLELGWTRALEMAAVMALIFSLVNSLRGLGRISWHSARPAYAFDILLSSTITTLGAAALNWVWPRGHFFPVGMVVEAGLLAFLGFLAVRYRERLLSGLAWRWLSRPERSLGERVLIIGAGDCGLLACWLLQHSQLASAFSVIGMVDDDPRREGLLVDGHRVFGWTRRIPELVEKMDVGVLLFAIESIRPEEKQRILELCRQTSARLIVIPDLLATLREQITQQPLPAATDRVPSARPLSATGEGQD